jgi:alpha-tubulin suppressor-like RCC1 family protein
VKIRCGDMYMVRLDHPSNVYGWAVSRVWWKPWRYNLRFYYMGNEKRINWVGDLHDEVHRNLSLDGVKGMLKLFELWKD